MVPAAVVDRVERLYGGAERIRRGAAARRSGVGRGTSVGIARVAATHAHPRAGDGRLRWPAAMAGCDGRLHARDEDSQARSRSSRPAEPAAGRHRHRADRGSGRERRSVPGGRSRFGTGSGPRTRARCRTGSGPHTRARCRTGSGPRTRARCRVRLWATHSRKVPQDLGHALAQAAVSGDTARATNSRECRNREYGERMRGVPGPRARIGAARSLRIGSPRAARQPSPAGRSTPDEITGARSCIGRSQILDRAAQAGQRGCSHANAAILGIGQAAQGRTPARSAVGSRRGGVPVRGGAFPRVARSALDLGAVLLGPRSRRAAAARLLPVQAQRRHDARPPDARGLERAGCLQPDHASEPLRRRGHLCQE